MATKPSGGGGGGFKQVGGYELLLRVGSGAQGVVWKARRVGGSLNNFVAVKIIDISYLSDKQRELALTEVRVLSMMSNSSNGLGNSDGVKSPLASTLGRSGMSPSPTAGAAAFSAQLNSQNNNSSSAPASPTAVAKSKQRPHECVMRYVDSFVVGTDLCLVLEWAEGGTLQDWIDARKNASANSSANSTNVGGNNNSNNKAAEAATTTTAPQTLPRKQRRKMSPTLCKFIWHIAISLLSALEALHTNNVLHRDVKPANIMFEEKPPTFFEDEYESDDADAAATSTTTMGNRTHSSSSATPDFPRVLIGDFGVATVLDDRSRATTLIGTPFYLAPETCQGERYDYKSDIWALGCILYLLGNERLPFEAANYAALILRIAQTRAAEHSAQVFAAKGNRARTSPVYQLRELIDSCMHKSVKERPTSQLLLQRQFVIMMAAQLGLLNLYSEDSRAVAEKVLAAIAAQRRKEQAQREQVQMLTERRIASRGASSRNSNSSSLRNATTTTAVAVVPATTPATNSNNSKAVTVGQRMREAEAAENEKQPQQQAQQQRTPTTSHGRSPSRGGGGGAKPATAAKDETAATTGVGSGRISNNTSQPPSRPPSNGGGIPRSSFITNNNRASSRPSPSRNGGNRTAGGEVSPAPPVMSPVNVAISNICAPGVVQPSSSSAMFPAIRGGRAGMMMGGSRRGGFQSSSIVLSGVNVSNNSNNNNNANRAGALASAIVSSSSPAAAAGGPGLQIVGVGSPNKTSANAARTGSRSGVASPKGPRQQQQSQQQAQQQATHFEDHLLVRDLPDHGSASSSEASPMQQQLQQPQQQQVQAQEAEASGWKSPLQTTSQFAQHNSTSLQSTAAQPQAEHADQEEVAIPAAAVNSASNNSNSFNRNGGANDDDHDDVVGAPSDLAVDAAAAAADAGVSVEREYSDDFEFDWNDSSSDDDDENGEPPRRASTNGPATGESAGNKNRTDNDTTLVPGANPHRQLAPLASLSRDSAVTYRVADAENHQQQQQNDDQDNQIAAQMRKVAQEGTELIGVSAFERLLSIVRNEQSGSSNHGSPIGGQSSSSGTSSGSSNTIERAIEDLTLALRAKAPPVTAAEAVADGGSGTESGRKKKHHADAAGTVKDAVGCAFRYCLLEAVLTSSD